MKIHLAVELFHVNRQTDNSMLYNIIFFNFPLQTHTKLIMLNKCPLARPCDRRYPQETE